MIHAKSRHRMPLIQPAVVHVRRSYSDCRFGQIHLWTAYPSGGGFDERTPVLCLHDAGGSGRRFAPILAELGRDRSIYAPDLPGHGTSDAPTSKASVTDLAGAVADFLDSLRLRHVDVFGYQLGALVATELAIARPQQIRRVLFWGVPLYTAPERVGVLARATALGSREDGSDVIDEWRHSVEARGGMALAAVADEFADRLHAGAHGARALGAVLDYPANQRLPLLKQPSALLRTRDEFWEHAPRLRAQLPQCSIVDVADQGRGLLSAAPQRFTALAKEFFDR